MLRATVRDSMKLDEVIATETKKRHMVHSPRKQLSLMPDFAATKGFSQNDVEEDEEMKLERLLRKRRPNAGTNRGRGAIEEDEDRVGRTVIDDEKVFVHYPVKECGIAGRKRTYNVLPVTLAQQVARRNLSGGELRPDEVSQIQNIRTNSAQPHYIEVLHRVDGERLSRLSGGSMALDMRRFQQKQRERLPTPPGHLPVRRRYASAEPRTGGIPAITMDDVTQLHLKGSTSLPESRLSKRSTSSFHSGDSNHTSYSLPTNDVAKMRIFIPRRQRLSDSEADGRYERDYLLRLRKAGESHSYQRALCNTRDFLGGRPTGETMVPCATLSKVEIRILDKVNKKATSCH